MIIIIIVISIILRSQFHFGVSTAQNSLEHLCYVWTLPGPDGSSGFEKVKKTTANTPPSEVRRGSSVPLDSEYHMLPRILFG